MSLSLDKGFPGYKPFYDLDYLVNKLECFTWKAPLA
jgi:hypothetical protein